MGLFTNYLDWEVVVIDQIIDSHLYHILRTYLGVIVLLTAIAAVLMVDKWSVVVRKARLPRKPLVVLLCIVTAYLWGFISGVVYYVHH